jgi:hypothetical protein
VANIITPGTSFVLPSGILAAGKSYVFSVSVVASTSSASASLLASSPFKTGLDIAEAATVSGIFTP